MVIYAGDGLDTIVKSYTKMFCVYFKYIYMEKISIVDDKLLRIY